MFTITNGSTFSLMSGQLSHVDMSHLQIILTQYAQTCHPLSISALY